MQEPIVITGRLIGPKNVELDEPVSAVTDRVEVIVHPVDQSSATTETVFDFLRRLPPGTRTREDIDAQIREERESWGDR